ncbi:hypothetical protein [Usitatibacter palustris]|uniref:Uncharacterized protein n=1 Tax=Usitatibacter palustris TaxID=2732487 RepID=A0A6M4HAQ0_9PROT|nr:hypothetical protein [Usitatibacter palustris]QJR16205.1 hypothetical protein DSM104440_03034 [Usitatibacter palustris]
MTADSRASSLLARVIEKYRLLASYQDTGVVLQPLSPSDAPIETKFTTRFRRPHFFRFAFSSPHPFPPLAHLITSHCCGLDDAGAYAWMKIYEEPATLKPVKNISIAVASATGISGGSAHTIGALLMPEVGGLGLDQLKGISFLGEERFEAANCLVIAGSGWGAEVSLWIDRESLMIRKVRTKIGAHPPADEIRRNIQIDESIPDREFERPSSGH